MNLKFKEKHAFVILETELSNDVPMKFKEKHVLVI